MGVLYMQHAMGKQAKQPVSCSSGPSYNVEPSAQGFSADGMLATGLRGGRPGSKEPSSHRGSHKLDIWYTKLQGGRMMEVLHEPAAVTGSKIDGMRHQ
jgi:hypothetical protein